jgi:signal transduction histidine kinase
MCQDLLASLEPEAESASIEFIGPPFDHTEIVGDGLKLRQVMENLLRNAMESFAGTAAPQKKITVSIVSTPADLRIKVEDNGAGLPGNSSEKIFDPFFTTKARGTGLGLSIASEIVRAHQGTLTIKSASGVGTIAQVTLPRLADHLRTAEASELGGQML